MKIRFLKSVLVDVQKARLDEVWDKQYSRWDELNVESLSCSGKKATIYTTEGDTLIDVPVEAFEKV